MYRREHIATPTKPNLDLEWFEKDKALAATKLNVDVVIVIIVQPRDGAGA